MISLRRKLTILILLISLSLAGNAQDEDLIQLSGVIRNEFLQPLQFTHILITNQSRGTISDQKGMFSFIVEPYDTILFSAVGFKKVGLIIPDTLKTFHLEVDIYMETDTIMIEEVISSRLFLRNCFIRL